VAHDFNNLLTGIMNYVELCRDELPTPHPAREYLDEITHDAERSAGIARQLLAFARKQVIAPQVLDLNDALAGMLKMLRHLLGEDIDLTWQPGAVLWEVRLDPSQLDQILANLTVNARDAIGGVGALAIETRNATLGPADCAEFADAVPGEYVMLAVSDSGCGMDADTLRHLFEPFFTTKGVGEGTGLGLGLATIYGIVRQNGGFIAVTSELGKGTTFRIYLPRSAAAGAPATAAAALPACRGGTETILLVEDERSVRTTSRLFLEALGYTVLAAADPEDAIHLAAAQPGVIDLLVTDVVMPGLNGCDLARHLASQRPTLKCLFMSGYTADTIAHRGLLDQDLHFLAKPFLRDGLARKVRDILDEPPATPRAEHSDVSALALEPPL
jgi:CheY-like chemotaxis protein